MLGIVSIFEKERKAGAKRVVFASSHPIIAYHRTENVTVFPIQRKSTESLPSAMDRLPAAVGLAIGGLLHPAWLAGTFARSLKREGMPHFENFALARVPMVSRHAIRPHRRDNLSWDDLRRMRDRWKHRLVLRGVLSPEDMVLARECGVDGVIVSNHGDRQLDGAVAPLRMLRAIKQEAGALAVMYDSGIRRGTDVLKALALGASQVFLGRTFLYAAIPGGEQGVLRAIELLKSEVLRDMALLGRSHPKGHELTGALVGTETPGSF